MVKYNFVVSLIHSTMLNLDRIFIRIFNLSILIENGFFCVMECLKINKSKCLAIVNLKSLFDNFQQSSLRENCEHSAFSGPYSVRSGKVENRKTPNTDTSYAVLIVHLFGKVHSFQSSENVFVFHRLMVWVTVTNEGSFICKFFK